MRIQILPLPSVVVGEVVEEPFALIVDQYDAPTTEAEFDRWKHFKEGCGARAVLVTPETVEVVDRYAEPAEPQEPVPGNVDALRDLHRLAEYVHDNFPEDAAQGGGTIVDVAIRLLGEVSRHRGVKNLTAVDLRERAREWIIGFLAASDEDRVNCVALMLGAADDAIRCAMNHKSGEPDEPDEVVKRPPDFTTPDERGDWL